MTRPQCIVTAEVTPQRWRNGGGVTRELLAWPGADWQVRVSVADIERDGPFSAFPGVQRWFAVLQGAGVQLQIDGVPHRVDRGSLPVCFDGGATTECALIDGATRDLNLMLRGAQGSLQVVQPDAVWHPTGQAAGLFSAIAGVCRHDDQHTAMPPFSLLWFDCLPGRCSFSADPVPGRPDGTPVGFWLTATPEHAS